MGDMGNADSNGFTLYTNESSFCFDYENLIGNGSIFDQVIQDHNNPLWFNNQLSDLNELGIDEGQTRLTQHFNDESESNLVGADIGNDEPSFINILDAVLQGQDEPNQPMGNNEAWKRLLSETQDTGVESEQVMSPIRTFNHSPAIITMAPKPHGRPRKIKPLIDLTMEPKPHVIETKKRPGRKPVDSCSTTSAPTTNASTSSLSIGKKTKRQKMLEEAAEKNVSVVCFGNQVVPKETPEYVAKRVKNNEAVKKSRAKKAQENLERDEKIPELHKENDTLKANLDSLVKEINEIKDNILLLNRGRNLPDDISKLFQQFENEYKRWLKF
jgi:hypothetical protein